MMFSLAERAVDKFFSHAELSPDDRELYVYGFFIVLSRTFFFIVTLAYGLLFDVIFESVLFYVFFALIRSYAGGLHASSESACTISTLISFFVSVALMKVCAVWNLLYLPICSFILSVPTVLLLSPLDSEAKPLSPYERKLFKRKSLLFTLLIFSLAISSFALRMPRLLYPCAASLLLESILLSIGKIKAKNLDRT